MSYVVLLASYCDRPKCSDRNPCRECLDMCNVFDVSIGADRKFVAEFGQLAKREAK